MHLKVYLRVTHLILQESIRSFLISSSRFTYSPWIDRLINRANRRYLVVVREACVLTEPIFVERAKYTRARDALPTLDLNKATRTIVRVSIPLYCGYSKVQAASDSIHSQFSLHFGPGKCAVRVNK